MQRSSSTTVIMIIRYRSATFIFAYQSTAPRKPTTIHSKSYNRICQRRIIAYRQFKKLSTPKQEWHVSMINIAFSRYAYFMKMYVYGNELRSIFVSGCPNGGGGGVKNETMYRMSNPLSMFKDGQQTPHPDVFALFQALFDFNTIFVIRNECRQYR